MQIRAPSLFCEGQAGTAAFLFLLVLSILILVVLALFPLDSPTLTLQHIATHCNTLRSTDQFNKFFEVSIGVDDLCVCEREREREREKEREREGWRVREREGERGKNGKRE